MKFGWQRSRIKGAGCRVLSAGDTANSDELKNDLEIRTPARAAGAILRAEAAPPPQAPQPPAALNTHSFRLPVGATDVGSLRNDIMEAKTGFLYRAKNPAVLART